MKLFNKWHDLRKDPNDLPSKTCELIVVVNKQGNFSKEVALYSVAENKFYKVFEILECSTKLNDVIAWCKIPPFEV